MKWNWMPQGGTPNLRYIWIFAAFVVGSMVYAKYLATAHTGGIAHADVKLDTQNPMVSQLPKPSPAATPTVQYVYIPQPKATELTVPTPKPTPGCNQKCEDNEKELAMYFEALHTGQGHDSGQQTRELPQVTPNPGAPPGWNYYGTH